MDKLKRYHVGIVHSNKRNASIAEHGNWCWSEDVAALEKENAELRKERDAIYSDMNRIVPEQDRRIAELLELVGQCGNDMWDAHISSQKAEDRADALAVE